MLQTTAQMGFEHLPGEGRTFGQDLFYPSCYILVGVIGGPKAVLSGWGQILFLHEDASFGDVPAACCLWGKPRDGALGFAFSQSHCRPLTTVLLLAALQGQSQTELPGMVKERAQDLLYCPGRTSCVFPVLPPAGCHKQYWVCPAWPLLILRGSSFGVSG